MKHTLGELAALLQGELKGPPDLVIEGIAPIDQATPREITFIAQKRYARRAGASLAGAFIVAPDLADLDRPLIIVAHPYLAYARVAATFAPPLKRWPGISDQACLGRELKLGRDVSIAPLVFIGERVRLGDGVTIMPGCFLGDEVQVGAGTLLYPNVTVLERCLIGERCTIHSGTVIGADGFGFVPTPAGNEKIPQLGTVVIADEVEIGANCTIDRGALGETRIGRGVKMDNLVHLAHNVTVGEHSMLVAQVGVSGSTKLGQRVILAGQVGLVGPPRTGRRSAGRGPIRGQPLRARRPDGIRIPRPAPQRMAPDHGPSAQTPGPLSETETAGATIGRTRRQAGQGARNMSLPQLPMTLEDIQNILPHRYPFLLVDRIVAFEPGKRIVGLKNVSINEPFFQGHFPGRPIMPGVLIIESLAQVGGILALLATPENMGNPSLFLMGLDKVRFRQPVVPGDQLRLEVETLRSGKKFWKMQGKAFVDDILVVEGEMMAAVGREE